MRPALPWLTQGDVFRSVPIPLPELRQNGQVVWDSIDGPALLLTHGCVLDKASNSGVMKIARVFFLPILSIESVDANARSLLRKRTLNPPEAIHLGVLGDLGESFATLSEAYYLPASLFAPRLSAFDHAEAEAGKRHLEATAADTRIGRIDEPEARLLLDKMNAFWTRREAVDADPSASGGLGDLARGVVDPVRQLVRPAVTFGVGALREIQRALRA